MVFFFLFNDISIPWHIECAFIMGHEMCTLSDSHQCRPEKIFMFQLLTDKYIYSEEKGEKEFFF